MKAPRYQRLIAFLEKVMADDKSSDKTRMMAALRLDDLYARIDVEENKVAAHKRKLELRELQVANPTIPLPEPEPVENTLEKTNAAFSFLEKKPSGGADAAVQSKD